MTFVVQDCPAKVLPVYRFLTRNWTLFSMGHLQRRVLYFSLSSVIQVCIRIGVTHYLSDVFPLVFILIATEILATNWHFPSNFTEVDLPDATLTPSNFAAKITDGKYIITVCFRHPPLTCMCEILGFYFC